MPLKFRRLIYGLVAVTFGFFLLQPLGALFDAMHWPVFNTWAQIHVTAAPGWATLTAVIFGCLIFLDTCARLDSLAAAARLVTTQVQGDRFECAS
jgi:hypothetical protein